LVDLWNIFRRQAINFMEYHNNVYGFVNFDYETKISVIQVQ